jgi:hypothetical protein
MKINILTLASAALLALSATALAQPPKPVVAAGTTIRAKQVLGTKIQIGTAAVGTVDDLVFDDAGNLEYLIVADDTGKLLTVPFEAAKWDLEKKVGTLTITPEVYRTIPRYTVTTYPSFYTPTYRTETYKVYGLTPRELRRIERRIP